MKLESEEMVAESLKRNWQVHIKVDGEEKELGPQHILKIIYCEVRCLSLLRLCPLLYGTTEVKKALNLKYYILSLCSVPRLTLTDVLILNRCL